MKKIFFIISVLFCYAAIGQTDTTGKVRGAIEVLPKLFNAIDNDSVNQVVIRIFDLVANDTVSGCNSKVEYYTRKNKKLFEKNVPIPAAIVNNWGTSDAILNVYVLSQIGLIKK